MNKRIAYIVILLLVAVVSLPSCHFSKRTVYSADLSHWSDSVPDGTEVQVALQPPHDVALKRGGRMVDLGSLRQQFPNTPLRTILLDSGNDRFIVGYVDETITGTPKSVVIDIPNPDAPIPEGKVAMVQDRVFVLPIFAHTGEISHWNKIDQIIVNLDISRTGVPVVASETSYNPPLDIRNLWVTPD